MWTVLIVEVFVAALVAVERLLPEVVTALALNFPSAVVPAAMVPLAEVFVATMVAEAFLLMVVKCLWQ